MFAQSSVEALGLRLWRLTPFDGQYSAINLGLRTRVTSCASVEDDLEFTVPGKYLSQAGQAKFSESREDWSLLLELNHWNVMMRPGSYTESSGQRTAHARTPSRRRAMVLICQYATAWSMLSTSSPRMSCRGRQLPLQDRRELKGASWRLGICVQVLTAWDILCVNVKTYFRGKSSF